MELGKRIRGRYLTTGRRKGMVAPSGLLERYMPGRYGRRFLALRPLALAHVKRAGERGERQGVVHLHLHRHFPWQVNLVRHFTGIYQPTVSKGTGVNYPLASFRREPAPKAIRGKGEGTGTDLKSAPTRLAVIPAKAGIQEFWRLQRIDSRQKHSGMIAQKIVKASVPTRLSTSPSSLGGDGGDGGEVLRKLHRYLPRLSIFTHSLPVAGFAATGAQPSHQGPSPEAIQGRGDDMRLIVRGQSVGTDIRVLSPRVVTNAVARGYEEAAVAIKNVVRQEAQGNTPPLIQAGTGHEAVRLVVKQETSNTASAEAPSQSVSATSVAPQITTTGPATTSVAVQSVQAKIDVNRLTDEVYRMLERRLVTERERRGR